MTRPALLLAALALLPAPALAANDNVEACIAAAKSYAGKELSAFDAAYQGRYLGLSRASWEGVVCEVKLGTVVNLTVDGTQVITEFFAGADARALHAELEAETKRAIAVLENRVEILEGRLEEAETRLKSPKPDLEAIRRFIAEGVEKAL